MKDTKTDGHGFGLEVCQQHVEQTLRIFLNLV